MTSQRTTGKKKIEKIPLEEISFIFSIGMTIITEGEEKQGRYGSGKKDGGRGRKEGKYIGTRKW